MLAQHGASAFRPIWRSVCNTRLTVSHVPAERMKTIQRKREEGEGAQN